MIDAGSAALKKRNDQRHFFLLGDLREFFGGRAGNRLREIEKLGVFLAAKVFAMKKFVQGNDLRAARGGFANFPDGPRQILIRVRRAFHLHEPDGKFVRHEIQSSMSRK